MDWKQFSELAPADVQQIVRQYSPDYFALTMPFNGTRRWYCQQYGVSGSEFASHYDDYSVQSRKRLFEIAEMIFADGVTHLVTPIFGRDLAERGAEYMEIVGSALADLANDSAINWYHERRISAACYGELDLLPEFAQTALGKMNDHTLSTLVQHYWRFGVFADRPTETMIALITSLTQRYGVPPTETQLLEAYYQAPYAQAAAWIGTDQPTVFDVPMMINGQTALYFLQFPTLFLDQTLWRRILYDRLFIRGDEESLHDENMPDEALITGLGIRDNGYWEPSVR